MTIKDKKTVLQKAGGPDVFVRNHVKDFGVVPFTGPKITSSPDIIAMENPVINPTSVFGGSYWLEPFLVNHKVRYGRDNYIYMRLANRGTVVDTVTLALYWVIPADCILFSAWNLLGKINVATVTPGEKRVVGPIVWRKADNPGIGAYSMIAYVWSQSDPITIPASFPSVPDFHDFLRNNNNICHRSIAILGKGQDSLML